MEPTKKYSQNNEDHYIQQYFRDKKDGNVLDIGANDGKTLSNSLALIELGWGGTLVEPSKETFEKLKALHADNDKVECFEVGICDNNGVAKMQESGSIFPDKADRSLVSTMSAPDYEKWKNAADFKEVEINTWDFKTLLEFSKIKKFDFITCDAEGFDMIILKQMNLTELGCSLICIEHNGPFQPYVDYIAQFGHKTIHINAENLIMGL